MTSTRPEICFPSLPAFRLLSETCSPYAMNIAGKPLYQHIHDGLSARHTGPAKLFIDDPLLSIDGPARRDIEALFDVEWDMADNELTPATGAGIPLGGEGSNLAFAEPWHLLDILGEVMRQNESWISPEATIEAGCQIEGAVRIEAGVRILAGTRLKGQIYIGRDAFIGNDVLVRGNTSLAAGCAVGHATEIKSSIAMEGASIGPASAVIDSVLGANCMFGGSVRTMNTNPSGATIGFKAGDTVSDTQRLHLGAVIGEGAILASGVLVSPGRNVGPGSFVGPGVVVMQNIPPQTRAVLNQNLNMTPIVEPADRTQIGEEEN